MNKEKWYLKYSPKTATSMVSFDFESYMRDKKYTIHDITSRIPYSISGILRMFKRGTIKKSLIPLLGDERQIKKYIRSRK